MKHKPPQPKAQEPVALIDSSAAPATGGQFDEKAGPISQLRVPPLDIGTPAGVSVCLAAHISDEWLNQFQPLVPKDAEALWQALKLGSINLRSLERGQLSNHCQGDSEVDVAAAFVLLSRLWTWQALCLTSSTESPALEIWSTSSDDALNLGVGVLTGSWRATRFASLRRDGENQGDSGVIIENPRSTVATRVDPKHAARIAKLFGSFLLPFEIEAAVAADSHIDQQGGNTADLLFLLAVAGVIARTDKQGRLPEDSDTIQRQWEHHDLLFHFRSRQGRHRYPMGAGFRFKGVLDPQPALKVNPWSKNAIVLPRPNLNLLAMRDLPFTAVLEGRRSIRAHDQARPINVQQIGEFLFRSARVRSIQQTEIGEMTSRPYPSGGASYELEIYLSVNQVAGLARGFYYYDAQAHTLCMVRPPNGDMEALLDEAWISAARTCRPQVLLTLASRFQRVSWKYDGMAYAAQLKNLGALYQTFYLVATAMNLAACGLGLGNSSRFNRLSDTDYLVESSVGEFMLGVPG